MSSILVDDHKDTIINVRSNSMNLPLVEAIPDDPEEATQNADPDSCRMLLNPRVTVAPSKHEFLRRDDDKDDQETRKKRSRDRRSQDGDMDDKTHDLLDRMTRDVATRGGGSRTGSRVTSPDRRSVISNRADKLDDFNTFIQSATVAPPLVAPTEKLTPEARRRLKAELLQEYQKKNSDYSYCPTVLTLEDPLEDIMDAVEFVRIKKSHESAKTWAKNAMGMASYGLVHVVNKFDLVGCDMTPWREDFAYELGEQGKYDDMLDDIIRTYRSKITIPTEYKLVLAIGTSFAKGVFTCKAQAAAEKDRRERLEAQRALKETQESQREQARNMELMRQHLEQQQQQHQEQQQQLMQQMQQFQYQMAPQTLSPVQMPVQTPAPPRGIFDGPKNSIQEMRALLADRVMDDESSIESIASAPREIPIEIPVEEHEVHDEVTTTEAVPPPQTVPPKRRGRKPKPKPNKDNDEAEMLTLSL